MSAEIEQRIIEIITPIIDEWQRKLGTLVDIVLGGSLVSKTLVLDGSRTIDVDIRFLADDPDAPGLIETIEYVTGLTYRKSIKLKEGNKSHMLEAILYVEGLPLPLEIEGQLRDKRYIGWHKFYQQVFSSAQLDEFKERKKRSKDKVDEYKTLKNDMRTECERRLLLPYDLDKIYRNLIHNDLGKIYQARPSAFIICGAPGVGKSTSVDSILKIYKVSSYILLDPDLVRTELIKQGLPQREALGLQSRANRNLVDHAISEQRNIIYNSVCRNPEKIYEVIGKLREAGYRIVFSMVYVPKELALNRVENRNKYDPRPTDRRIASGSYDEINDLAENYIKGNIADEVLLFVNVTDAQLVYHRVGDNIRVCRNFAKYYNFDITCDAPPRQKKQRQQQIS